MAIPLIDRALRAGEGRKFKTFQKQVSKINDFEPELVLESDQEIRARADHLRERARNGEPTSSLLYESFALTREAAKRTLGMRHFDVQLIGGMILHDGAIAEMKTGEGKTLTATLPVVLNALSSEGVHVVTVNDYLARRDAEWMRPVYEHLGLTVGILQANVDGEPKHEAYAADITYGTNSEFGFDYLRDNLAMDLEDQYQRDHHYAIVDEVDNILIDEARTPLIISGAPEQAAALYYKFATLAKQLKPGKKPEGLMSKMDKNWLADFDYEFDEKHHTVAVTEQGVARAEKFLDVDNMYMAEHGNLVNHFIQALKAESLYKRDVDYAVVDREVHIIDEFTGRILEGRRWSEGLHQAVEAKEKVPIQEENQTVATITYQNYFRRYETLSGMTGTALTEATEFMKIYKLQVVEVPTNQPMIRGDQQDQIYKSKEGKWDAVSDEIAQRHESGQPVLVGTISVEVSELLAAKLKKRGVTHTVLNAKPEYAEREGEIIAGAGRLGAVTIATNMAGRGVDIKLGGDPEQLVVGELVAAGVGGDQADYDQQYEQLLAAVSERVTAEREQVIEAGGLFILGTERHESRRIDNQLRGRSGRQGDPGASRFYLSAEDDLVRLFAGDRVYKILDRLAPMNDQGEEQPLESKMLSKQIETAQKRVEEQNFLIRKHVLEYDDVMNQQREVIYDYRNSILQGENISSAAHEQFAQVVERMGELYLPGDYVEEWDFDGLFTQIQQLFPSTVSLESFDMNTLTKQEIVGALQVDIIEAYKEREEQLGEDAMRTLERVIFLQIIDDRWREHLHAMEYLREGIHLRGFAQLDPLVAYKNEGYDMFAQLIQSIWEEFARFIFHVNVELTDDAGTVVAQSPGGARRLQYQGGQSTGQPSALQDAVAAETPQGIYTLPTDEPAAPKIQPRSVSAREKMGRNELCWCGSGKKFKHCHG